jgi:hypothetical protein
VLAGARAIYHGQYPEGWEESKERLDPHVEKVVAEIRRLADEAMERMTSIADLSQESPFASSANRWYNPLSNTKAATQSGRR